MKQKGAPVLTHDEQVTRCSDFLTNFQQAGCQLQTGPYAQYGAKKYLILMQRIANGITSSFSIYFEDLESHFCREEDNSILRGLKNNTDHYLKIFTRLVQRLMPKRNIAWPTDQEHLYRFQHVLREQRRQNYQATKTGLEEKNESIPIRAYSDYDVGIVYGDNHKFTSLSINQVSSRLIGSLVAVKAIVTRMTEVKPKLQVATYACDICGYQNYLDVQNAQFKPVKVCQSKVCRNQKFSGKLTFLPGHSKFVPYQQLHIQELSEQLGFGSVPQTLTVVLQGSLVKTVSPGDIVTVQGILLPSVAIHPNPKGSISYDKCLLGMKIDREKKRYSEISLSQQTVQHIHHVRTNMQEDDLFNKLAKSICPEIYGHQAIKKALLLQMAGGITKETYDFVKIRGEINIALVGDPGVAKSQLLKYIAKIAPRAIYTTGKGSSGAGLTAAISKDPFTHDICLEAGALVLADTGVCCIDEFDKMQETDRTSIHEIMEQQTVSIAKAGITTTMNARTAILAASNPLYGRYNTGESVFKNVNMPAALLSRFDLVFVLVDKHDPDADLALAQHVCEIHRSEKYTAGDIFQPEFVRDYVSLAKTYSPIIQASLHEDLVDRYVYSRKGDPDSIITIRNLLGLVRMCQARAKLRFSNEVSMSDVLDCLEIIEESQHSVRDVSITRRALTDKPGEIYSIIKDMCKYSIERSVKFHDVERRCGLKGYGVTQVMDALQKYSKLNVVFQRGESIFLIE